MNASSDLFERASEATEYVRRLSPVRPSVGIVLGSGLGEFAAGVDSPVALPYAQIPHFPQPTIEGHSGNLILGTIAGVPVAVMQGRVHAYEGRSMEEITFPTRVLGLLGVSTLVVTNAAGGINPEYAPGSLVLISDHINLTGMNPVAGPNEPRFGRDAQSGKRFFDMSFAYTPTLREIARQEADRQGYDLHVGVYAAVLGPSYETPAEIRAFRALGADLIGMSTVHEVIVARHMGLNVLGLSLVTNPAAGVTSAAINHAEVMEFGRQTAARLAALVKAVLPRIETARPDKDTR